ncbi:MAG: trehalose 6-phosphate phosphorylase [Rhodospirillaceae bacterium]|nr:trehalose 6-phosphate phosphorylase [Rhodospirillaceae bacterium]
MSVWTLEYDHFDPEQERLREALCTLGNGYFATRGAAESVDAGPVHYPGTYFAGGYNRLKTEIRGHVVENEDLVNMPNWLSLTFRHADGAWFDLDAVEIGDYRQTLDLKRGVLEREILFTDEADRRTRLLTRRIVHMGSPHLAAIEMILTPENWSGEIEVKSAIDGRVTNAGVDRYKALSGRHLDWVDGGAGGDGIAWLMMRTTQSRLEVAEAARTCLFLDGGRIVTDSRLFEEQGYVATLHRTQVDEGVPLRVEKIVGLFTCRDDTIAEAGMEAREAVQTAPGFATLLASHTRGWEHLWRRFGLDIEGNGALADHRTEMVLRLHIFHLLQTASLNTIELDVGVPARGLHGEAYRGHIFWDELFIFPFLNLRVPEITRALLKYRYRRLGEARKAARDHGYRGAMYPWQSGSNGREESQVLHLNPQSGRWLPDNTFLQRHINSAVAYNVWQYYEVSGDLQFLATFGAEMILEIARFWASIASFDEKEGRYRILGVVGPDEYHTAYPGASAPGLDDNAYTNVMAVWVLKRALDVLELLPEERRVELCELLGLDSNEFALWSDITQRMRLAFHDGGIISQFDGYGDLDEFDWEGYRKKYGDIQRLDRILEAEGDTPNRYKLSKQADALMLFYLFTAEELSALIERLGYQFDSNLIRRNIDYYAQRTSHGSTLSRVVHSWVLARSDRARSWSLFEEALLSDVSDTQGGTTAEGIHLGAMAGTVDLIQRGYTGIETRSDVLRLNPALPEGLTKLCLKLRYRGHSLRLQIADGTLELTAATSVAPEMRVRIFDSDYSLEAGATIKAPL